MRNVIDYSKRKYGCDEYGNLYLKSRKHSIAKQNRAKENKPYLCKVLCDMAKSMSHKP